MLVLSRKKNQTIIIDGQIEIEVLKIKGNTVRLGITAPSDIKVLRGELSPFEIEMRMTEATDGSKSEFPMVEEEDLTMLPNPFAVAHAS
ncbi:MAG: carbon storage regulator [Mariniblastus sp.]